MKTLLIRCCLTALAFLPLAVRAEKPINATLLGVAIKGYDPVAYFTEAKALKGVSDVSFEWRGATWRFASAANRDLFKASPETYAPQYGGYCAWAVSRGYTAGIDPAAWKVVNGKLYLNYSLDVQKKWEADIPGNIAKADAAWPGVLKK